MTNKTVSKKRIDVLLRKSIFMQLTSLGHKMYARLDKLSFVSDLSEEDNEELFNRLGEMKTAHIYSIKNRKASKGECGGLYHCVVEIRLACKWKGHPVALVIYYRPTAKQQGGTSGITQRGAVRMELSPQHYTAAELTALFLWLGKVVRLGRHLYLALKKAWITDVHYALDIVGIRVRDFYLSLSGARTGKVFEPDYGMEGIRIGSAKSKYHASCYEKVDILNADNEEEYLQQTIIKLTCGEYRDFVRFELRLSPGKGKLPLTSINDMENLPSHLNIYGRGLRKDKLLDPAFAALLDKGMSISQAFSEHKPSAMVNGQSVSPTKKQASKRLFRLLVKYKVELFDANVLWNKLPLVTDKLGILAQPQYWAFKHRKKWLESRKK